MDNSVDPRWAKEIRDVYEFYDWYSKEAARRNLYVHGEEKDEFVEAIINR